MSLKQKISVNREKPIDYLTLINSAYFQRLLLSVIVLAYSVITFFEFGLPSSVTAKLKNQIPSLTLTFLALVTTIEIADRMRQDKSRQETRKKLEKLSDVEEGLISRCAIEVEGECPTKRDNFLQGTWLSLYQDQDASENLLKKMKWSTEIIEIIELGSILYLNSKADEQQKMIQGLGRYVKDGVILGHWINCGAAHCKQGEFLLEISHNDHYLFGYYNRPHSEYKHFYKWILIKAIDKNKDSILKELDNYLDEAWEKMKQLKEDDLTTIYSKNQQSSKYDALADSFEKLIANIPVVD
jgi:hypothetical protein